MENKAHKGSPVLGNLACFCIDEERQGQPIDKTYEFKETKKQICKDFLTEKWVAETFGSLMSCIIVLINYFLRLLIIWIVERIGEQTESRAMETTTFFIFISQYINTALLLTIAAANLVD